MENVPLIGIFNKLCAARFNIAGKLDKIALNSIDVFQQRRLVAA